MAKIAVLFMLFALVAVGSAGRLPRETAPAQPVNMFESFNDFTTYVQNVLKSPETEKNVKPLQDMVKNIIGEDAFNNLVTSSQKFGKDAEEFWKKTQSQ